MNGYSLAYVALAVDNVDAVATIFARDLGLRLCLGMKHLGAFFAVWLCEFAPSPVRSGCP